MELADLMHKHQESMKAAQQEAEARKGRRPKAVPKRLGCKTPSASDGKPVKHTPEERELAQKEEPSTPQKDSTRQGDRSPSTPAPPLAPRRRLRLRPADEDAKELSDTMEEPKGMKRRHVELSTCPSELPMKRSARIAATEKVKFALPQPKPFDSQIEKVKSRKSKHMRSRSGDTEPCEEQSPSNELPEMPKSTVEVSASGKGANVDSVAAGDEEVGKQQQQDLKQEKSTVTVSLAVSHKVLPDPRVCWQKLHTLMQRLPKSHGDEQILSEDIEVANLLEVARCCLGDFSGDPAINFFKLTAANSLLDLAAAIDESGELAPIMTMSIATRGILNMLAQHMSGLVMERTLLVDLLEPVPTADHLTKLLGHVEELWMKSSLQKTSRSNSFEVFQKYGSLAVNPDHDPRNLEVATCRPAACAVLALSKTLAMEAADAECHHLAILEARAQVRRASAEAAEKAAMELSSSFAQKELTLRGHAAVAAAAEEAEKEVKEFQRLHADICQGRDILKNWTSLLEAHRPPPEISGRPVDVSATDWVRMKDGQHLNDSLIDLFVSMLVGLLGGSRMHAFSSHFYSRLAGPDEDESGIDQGWQRVRTWTRAVRRRHVTGIFACDYLLVPLHHEEEHHWSLAVVCRPWAAIAQLDNWVCPSHTTVAFLDSLWSPSSEIRQEIVMKKLCQYLECEWRVCGAVGTFQSSRVEAVAVDVPQQTNNFDCGIYVLEFVLQLLQHPWRLAALGQSQVVFEVCDADPRKRWHDAAMKLRAMKEAAPAAGVESAWFAAQLWLQELQKPKAETDQPQS